MKRLIPVIILLIISLVVWNFLREKVYVTDSDFVMRENKFAPDGKHRIIKFDIDIGAWGYTGSTAITPSDFEDLNLAQYKLPRCIEAFGWTDNNELIVSIEDCKSSEQIELKAVGIVRDVKVQIVNADEYLLKQGLKRGKTIPPPVEPK
jgi:hypothetical protein